MRIVWPRSGTGDEPSGSQRSYKVAKSVLSSCGDLESLPSHYRYSGFANNSPSAEARVSHGKKNRFLSRDVSEDDDEDARMSAGSSPTPSEARKGGR